MIGKPRELNKERILIFAQSVGDLTNEVPGIETEEIMAGIGVFVATMAEGEKVDIALLVQEIEQQAEFVKYTLEKAGWENGKLKK